MKKVAVSAKEPTITMLRQEAAQLLDAVLEEVLTPRQALIRWPQHPLAQEDPSLQAACQALWHFESDEDQQQKEVYYLDVQLQVLEQMFSHLTLGHCLPPALIAFYPPSCNVVAYENQWWVVTSLMRQWKKQWLQFKQLVIGGLGTPGEWLKVKTPSQKG